MRYLFVLLTLISLTGCRGKVVRKIDPTDVSKVILTFSSKLKYERHLRLADSVVYYEDNINRIRVDYETQDIMMDLWKARELLVEITEGLLERINNNGYIAAQLANYPMKPEDLEVHICFTSFYSKYVDLQNSALVTLRNGIANYFTYTAVDCNVDCWKKRQEYYWQSKMFTEYNRLGEFMHAPEKVTPEAQSFFDVERYFPKNNGRQQSNTHRFKK